MLQLCLAMLDTPEEKAKFQAFYDKFNKKIYYIALKHLKKHELAEECTQDILLHFAQNFEKVGDDLEEKRVENYVRVVSKCMSVDAFRREKNYIYREVNADIEDFYDIADVEYAIDDVLTARDAIEHLPEEYQEIYFLKYIAGYTGAEISKMLKLSQPLVRKRCMIGNQKMKEYLGVPENTENKE